MSGKSRVCGLLTKGAKPYTISMKRLWIHYNPNPKRRRTIDCAVRAVAGALGLDWDTAWMMIAAKSFDGKGMSVENANWGAILRRFGFKRAAIPNTCPDCYTAADFIRDHPRGTFVLGFDDHTAVVIAGRIYDTWDSTGEIPQYYWYREA